MAQMQRVSGSTAVIAAELIDKASTLDSTLGLFSVGAVTIYRNGRLVATVTQEDGLWHADIDEENI